MQHKTPFPHHRIWLSRGVIRTIMISISTPLFFPSRDLLHQLPNTRSPHLRHSSITILHLPQILLNRQTSPTTLTITLRTLVLYRSILVEIICVAFGVSTVLMAVKATAKNSARSRTGGATLAARCRIEAKERRLCCRFLGWGGSAAFWEGSSNNFAVDTNGASWSGIGFACRWVVRVLTWETLITSTMVACILSPIVWV